MTTGIKNGGTNLKVTAGTDFSVNIHVGMANIKGYQMIIKQDTDGTVYNLALPAANMQYPTVFRVVIRLNPEITVRTVTPEILISTGETNPTAPVLTREDGGIWELSLAQIRIQANATTITDANITDERFDTDLCGIINSVFSLDPSVWQEQFNSFMDSIEDDNELLKTEMQQAFSDLTSGMQTDYNNWKTTIDGWKDMTITQLAQVLSFSFENQFAYPGTTLKINIDDDTGTITEELTYTNSGAVFARQTTTFNSDGSVTEAQTVYNTDGTTFRNVTATTTFFNGLPITEVA